MEFRPQAVVREYGDKPMKPIIENLGNGAFRFWPSGKPKRIRLKKNDHMNFVTINGEKIRLKPMKGRK